MRKHHSVLGGVALALALTLTGCSDDGTDPDAQDTPTATPSTPDQHAAHTQDARGEGRGPAADVPRRARRRLPRARPSTSRRLNTVATGDEFLQLQHDVARHDE